MNSCRQPPPISCLFNCHSQANQVTYGVAMNQLMLSIVLHRVGWHIYLTTNAELLEKQCTFYFLCMLATFDVFFVYM